MFDLEFYNIVRAHLSWTQAPQVAYINAHQDIVKKRNTPTCRSNAIDDMATMSAESMRLHEYVDTTYPPYFGLSLRMGNAYLSTMGRVMMQAK